MLSSLSYVVSMVNNQINERTVMKQKKMPDSSQAARAEEEPKTSHSEPSQRKTLGKSFRSGSSMG